MPALRAVTHTHAQNVNGLKYKLTDTLKLYPCSVISTAAGPIFFLLVTLAMKEIKGHQLGGMVCS